MAEFKSNDCYVAFIDLLGFKNMINHKTQDEIANIFIEVEKLINGLGFYVKTNNGAERLIEKKDIHHKIMSDSIVFFIDSNVKNALYIIITLCNVVQMRLLDFPDPILARGAISRGDMYLDGDKMFGKGLTKAYTLENGCAKYPRYIIPLNIVDEYTDYDIITNPKNYLYDDSDGFYCIDYLSFYLKAQPKREDRTAEKIEKLVYDALIKYSDLSIREKYLYLKKNLDRIKK